MTFRRQHCPGGDPSEPAPKGRTKASPNDAPRATPNAGFETVIAGRLVEDVNSRGRDSARTTICSSARGVTAATQGRTNRIRDDLTAAGYGQL